MPKGVKIALICILLWFAFIIGRKMIFSIPATIKMERYVEVNFDGPDGDGYPVITYDYDAFAKKYGKDLQYRRLARGPLRLITAPFERWVGNEMADKDDAAMYFINNYFGAYIEPQYGLKNGDTVTLTWYMNENMEDDLYEEYRYKVKYEEKEYQVSGLLSYEQYQLRQQQMMQNGNEDSFWGGDGNPDE